MADDKYKKCEPVEICLSVFDLSSDYVKNTGVTLVSLLEHSSKPISIHILHGDENGEEKLEIQKNNLNKLVYKYNASIKYHSVKLPETVVSNLKEIKQKPYLRGSLLRLMIPEIFKDYKKIIYLDSDIVVLTDIIELWKTPLGKYNIAASVENYFVNHPSYDTDKYFKRLGIHSDKYFNGGVLIMKPSAIYQSHPGFTDTIFNFLEENPDVRCLDQDALNWFFKDEYFLLDKKYNVFPWWNDINNYSTNCILHYNTGKPWEYYHGPIDDYYWDYLLKTTWCEDIHSFYNYIRQAPNIEKIQHIPKNICEYIPGTRRKKIIIIYTIIQDILTSVLKSTLFLVKNKLNCLTSFVSKCE